MENSMTDRGAKEDRHKLQLPKNIRQIGNVQGPVRVYMEDYVYTYLHGNGRSGWAHRGSIFVGSRCQENGQKYLFVSGLVHIPDEYFKDGIPVFSDMMWGGIYQDMKCYYDQVEILGWGMDVAGASEKLTGNLEQIHRRAFQGQEKFAFLMDSLEKEEAFYIYEKNMLRRRDGYYVYYEKNPQMREYMMQGREEEGLQPEIDPQKAVVTNYRKISAKKAKRGSKVFQTAVYASCLALLVAVTAMGVNMMSSAGKIHKLEEAVSFLEADDAGVQSDALTENKQDPQQAQLQEESDQTQNALMDGQSAGTSSTQTEETAQEASDQKNKNGLNTDQNPADGEKAGQGSDDQSAAVQETSEQETSEQETSGEQKSDQSSDAENEEKPEKTQETAAFADQKYYIVKQGESLLGISQKLYGKDYTKKLCELNELEDENKIYAGQKLLLLDK